MPQVEDCISETIGCAIDVHREVGPGFVEAIYHRAMCVALSTRNLGFVTEYRADVVYRDTGSALIGSICSWKE